MIKFRRYAFGLAASTIALTAITAGCGGGSSSSTPSILVTSSAKTTIGTLDGVSMSIPAGSASTGTRFYISNAAPSETPASTADIVGVSSNPVQITTTATSFDGPIYITLPYNPSLVTVGSNQSLQNSLRIAVSQNNGGVSGWNTALNAQIVSTTDHTVTAELPTFSNTGIYSVVQIIAPGAPASHPAK